MKIKVSQMAYIELNKGYGSIYARDLIIYLEQ